MKNKYNKAVTDYWMAHYLENDLCSLCGNSGVIHTEGVRTAAGVLVGRANYCICPNGQAMRDQSGNLTQRPADDGDAWAKKVRGANGEILDASVVG